MIAIIRGLRMGADEDVRIFLLRRHQRAVKSARAIGLWSDRTAMRILAWEEHIIRASLRSWATDIRLWRGSMWLRALRVLAGSQDDRSGKLGVRRKAGRPSTRWEDSVQWCQARSSSLGFTVSPEIHIKDKSHKAAIDRVRISSFTASSRAKEKLAILISFIRGS